MSKIDVKSLIIGTLLSLVAQGIYDALFYFDTGKPFEGYVAITIALVVASLVILIVAIIIDWNIFHWFRKKEDAVGFADTIEIVLKKKIGNQNVQIKHDGTGKIMTITYNDETGKEIKLETLSAKTQETKK